MSSPSPQPGLPPRAASPAAEHPSRRPAARPVEATAAMQFVAGVGLGAHWLALSLTPHAGEAAPWLRTVSVLLACSVPLFAYASTRAWLTAGEPSTGTLARRMAMPFTLWGLVLLFLAPSGAPPGVRLLLGPGPLQLLLAYLQLAAVAGILRRLRDRVDGWVLLLSAVLVGTAWADAGLRWTPAGWVDAGWAPHAALFPAWLPAIAAGVLAADRPATSTRVPSPGWCYWPAAGFLLAAWGLFVSRTETPNDYLGPARPDVLLASLLLVPFAGTAAEALARSRCAGFIRELRWLGPALFFALPTILAAAARLPLDMPLAVRVLLYGPGVLILGCLLLDRILCRREARLLFGLQPEE